MENKEAKVEQEQEKPDREVRIIRDDQGNERRVITFRPKSFQINNKIKSI